MFSYFINSFKTGVEYLKDHLHILFVLLLIILLPVLFFYNGQRFLDAGRENQTTIQNDKVGLLQDVFVSMMRVSEFDQPEIQDQIIEITRLNINITEFRVVALEGGLGTVFASSNFEEVDSPVLSLDRFKNATVDTDTTLSHEELTANGRIWRSYRAIEADPGIFYVTEVTFSLANVDRIFAQREREAMMTLVYIFMFVAGLVYWQIKQSDYKYLYKRAKQINETKDDFINMMAHELRAPLTAIKGYAELTTESATSPEISEYSKRISISSQRLLELINDLLDVARVQSGKMTISMNESDVAGVVRSVVQELEISASEKNIQITTTGAQTPHIALADSLRLHQAIANIVSNSIKYADKGLIEIEVTEKVRTVEIRVKDSGMGIDSEDQKKLFAPFFRVKRADVTQITGTGLGMWITKQIITLMNGTIGVESIRNVGTHIVINLPKPKKGS